MNWLETDTLLPPIKSPTNQHARKVMLVVQFLNYQIFDKLLTSSGRLNSFLEFSKVRVNLSINETSQYLSDVNFDLNYYYRW
jgi:hypothetical protein